MKNIIFDFGQVLIHFNEEAMTRRYVKNEADCQTVKTVVFDRLYWDRFDDGTLTTTQAKPLISARLPEHLHTKAFAVLDNWYRDLEFVSGMPELISDLKADGKKLFLLSNVGTDFAENYATVPELKALFSHFDGLVFSGVLGLVKPGKEIFEHILQTYNLNPSDSIFIDDRTLNIEGGEKAGIEGYLFDGDTQKLRQKLL